MIGLTVKHKSDTVGVNRRYRFRIAIHILGLGDDKPDMLLDNKQSIDIQEVKVINKGPVYVALDAQIDGVRYMGVLCASSDIIYPFMPV